MKITRVVRSDDAVRDHGILLAAGVIGERLAVEKWNDHKFAIDIDGNTNSWTTMLHRLLLGCCVLKVTSQEGWRQWYYDRLRPGIHFLPVKADLSDLVEILEWCRQHDDECRQIAAEGRAFAFGLNVEAEKSAAVQSINAAFCR